MDYKENEIAMTLDEYLELRDKAVGYESLLNVLFNKCTLGYGGAILFNDQNINGYLKYTVPDRYSRKVEEMRSAKGEQ